MLTAIVLDFADIVVADAEPFNAAEEGKVVCGRWFGGRRPSTESYRWNGAL